MRMTHEEISDLLGAFALDAVEPHERDEIDEHLATCPRCRAEVDAHRDVAAAMGNSVEPLPVGLWSSIAERLPNRHDEARPPMPRLVRNSDDGRQRQASDRSRAPRGRLVVLGSMVAAAAAVAAVLGINLDKADTQVSRLQQAAISAQPTAVETALETPGHQVVNLLNSSHHRVAQFVMVPDGRGYLVSSQLRTLPADLTYQLWGIVGNQPISLGLMGQSPSLVQFTLAGPSSSSKLAITVEPAGGSVVPTGSMVATGVI
jgi:anti-sigma-K factor RskA